MPKLYLVGVTEDRTGLVLAKSPRAKTGESVLEVDGDVLDAIAEIRRYRSEGAVPPSISSPALPTRHRPTGEGPSASSLSPREIQSRLRRGESIQSVARRAGIEAWRIEVYAAPIAAEQARIVARARELDMEKRGAGPSGRPLGDSVQANIVEKRVSMNVDEFESAWSAYEPEPDRWVVQFQYTSRGREQLAEWLYDPEAETISATNRLATTLGWRDPKRSGRLPPLPEAPRRETPKAPKKKSASSKKSGGSSKKSASKKKSGSSKKQSTPRKKTPTKKATPKKTPKKKPEKKTSSGGGGAKRSSSRARRSSSRSSKGSKGKRSKSPPARQPGRPTEDWRDELARRMADDRRGGDDDRTGSWRIVARPDADEAAPGSDDLDPPAWVQARSSRDDPGDETPAPREVRVVARRVTDASTKRGRRRRRRARRTG